MQAEVGTQLDGVGCSGKGSLWASLGQLQGPPGREQNPRLLGMSPLGIIRGRPSEEASQAKTGLDLFEMWRHDPILFPELVW